MDNLWLVLFWTGPIGIGIFLAGLGTLIWFLAKANEDQCAYQTFAKEKEIEKH
jgi:hypothetical protein